MPKTDNFHYSYLPWMTGSSDEIYKTIPEVQFADFEEICPKQVFIDQLKLEHSSFKGMNINANLIFNIGRDRYEDYITIKTIFFNIRSKNLAKVVLAQEYINLIMTRLEDRKFCERLAPLFGYYFEKTINPYLEALNAPHKVDLKSIWVPTALEMWFGIHFALPMLRRDSFEQNHFIEKMAQLCKIDLCRLRRPDFEAVAQLIEDYTTQLESENVEEIHEYGNQTGKQVPFSLSDWACSLPVKMQVTEQNGEKIFYKNIDMPKYIEDNFWNRIDDRVMMNPNLNMISRETDQKKTDTRTISIKPIDDKDRFLRPELEQKCEQGKGNPKEEIEYHVQDKIMPDLNLVKLQPESRKRSRPEFMEGNESDIGISLPKTKSIKINQDDNSSSYRFKTEQKSNSTLIEQDLFSYLVGAGISSEDLVMSYFEQDSVDQTQLMKSGRVGKEDPLGGNRVQLPRSEGPGRVPQVSPQQLEEKEDESSPNRVPLEYDPMDYDSEDDPDYESKE